MYGMEDQYNTELTPEEEKRFQAWATANGRSGDTYDYDMRGWWKENGDKSVEGHFTDKYKKPNHPTFSNESIYHGRDGNVGGEWSGEEGSMSFTPGRTNLENYTPLMLQDYFTKTEPNVRLVIPESR